MPNTLKNPFVGPRTFEESDKGYFFGRNREARQLTSLVISERLVLFYAQSGAGKSSLINTRLRPALDTEGFHVLPTGRVGGILSDEIKSVGNIFVFNLINSLESSQERVNQLTHTNFSEYWAGFLKENKKTDDDGDEKARLLIIDQFEEIVTTHLHRWEDRSPFFKQLADVMKADPLLWVVMSLREDHVASIEPYARIMPGGLRKRYYMQRMKRSAALKAIKAPADKEGRPFTDNAADQLADNLRQIRTRTDQIELEEDEVLGEFIEPVQLQVVCYQLWENLNAQADPPSQINQDDLHKFGDVDDALSQFYESAIATVLQEADTTELVLRKWFEEQLITEAGTRGTVYQGQDFTGGMANETVQLLSHQFLLHAEPRAGGLWFELVHDRFVEPILQANQAWRLKQNPLVQAAEVWDREDRPRTMLLQDEALETTLGVVNWNYLEPLVQEYLTESKQAQSVRDVEKTRREAEEADRRAKREARTARILRWLAIGLGIAIIFAAGFAYSAQQSADIAEMARQEAVGAEAEAKENAEAAVLNAAAAEAAEAEAKENAIAAVLNAAAAEAAEAEAKVSAEAAEAAEAEAKVEKDRAEAAQAESESRRLAAASLNLSNTNPQLAHLLAIEAGLQANTTEADQALRQALDKSQIENFLDYQDGATALSVSQDGLLLAYGGNDEAFHIYSIAEDRILLTLFSEADITDLHFLSQSAYLLSINDDNDVELWNVNHLSESNNRRKSKINAPTGEYAISHNGKNFAVITANAIEVRGVNNIFQPQTGSAINFAANHIALSADGNMLAGINEEGEIQLWSTTDFTQLPLQLNSDAALEEISFDPNGRWFIRQNKNDEIMQFTPTEALTNTQLLTSTQLITDVIDISFEPNGSKIATVGANGVSIWESGNLDFSPLFVINSSQLVTNLRFSLDGQKLFGTIDNIIFVWDSETGNIVNRLEGHSDKINHLNVIKDGTTLVTASSDGSIRFWSLNITNKQVLWADPVLTPIRTLISPDGLTVFMLVIEEESETGKLNSRLYLSDIESFRSGLLDTNQYLQFPFPITDLHVTKNGQILITLDFDLENFEESSTIRTFEIDALRLGETKPLNEVSLTELKLGWQIDPNEEWLYINTLSSNEESSRITTINVDSIIKATQPLTQTLWKNESGRFVVLDMQLSSSNIALLSIGDTPSRSIRSEIWSISETGNNSLEQRKLRDLGSLGTLIGGDPGIFATSLLSPDGQFLATFEGEETFSADSVLIWDFEQLLEAEDKKEALLATLRGHQDGITFATFSSNNLLATSDEKGEIRLWDVQRATLIDSSEVDTAVFKGHSDSIISMSFNPSGTQLYSASTDGTLRAWTIEFDHLIAEACGVARRNLVVAEFETHLTQGSAGNLRSTCPNIPPQPSVINELIRRGDVDLVKNVIDKANQEQTSVNPYAKMIENLLVVGAEQASLGEKEQALETLNMALVLSPTLTITPTEVVADKLIERARADLAEIGQFSDDIRVTLNQALRLAEEALELDASLEDRFAIFLIDLSEGYALAGQTDESVQALERSRTIDSERFDLLFSVPITDTNSLRHIVADFLIDEVQGSSFRDLTDQRLSYLLEAERLHPERLLEIENLLVDALASLEDSQRDFFFEQLEELLTEYPESALNLEAILSNITVKEIISGSDPNNIFDSISQALIEDPEILSNLSQTDLARLVDIIILEIGVEETYQFFIDQGISTEDTADLIGPAGFDIAKNQLLNGDLDTAIETISQTLKLVSDYTYLEETAFSEIMQRYMVTFGFEATRDYLSQLESSSSSSVSSSDTNTFLNTVALATVEQLAEQGNVSDALMVLKESSEYAPQPSEEIEAAQFDAYLAICREYRADSAEAEEIIPYCSQATDISINLGDAETITSICRSFALIPQLSQIVLPACEKSFELEETAFSEIMQRYMVTFGFEATRDYFSQLESSSSSSVSSSDTNIFLGIVALATVEQLAEQGNVTDAVMVLKESSEYAPQPSEEIEAAQFDAYLAICREYRADSTEIDDILFYCSQATDISTNLNEAESVISICHSFASEPQLSQIVLPACEKSLEFEETLDDQLYILSLCGLADISGYENISASACNLINTAITEINIQSFSYYEGEIVEAFDQQLWRFNGEEGQILVIEMNKIDPDLDPIIELLNSSGMVIGMDDDSGDNRNSKLVTNPLSESGQYYLRSVGYENSVGRYELIISLSE